MILPTCWDMDDVTILIPKAAVGLRVPVWGLSAWRAGTGLPPKAPPFPNVAGSPFLAVLGKSMVMSGRLPATLISVSM